MAFDESIASRFDIFGGSMIVDTHVHVIATDQQRYPLSAAPGFHLPGIGPWYADTPISVERLLEVTHLASVDRAIVVQAFSAYGYDNAYHADSAALHPERLASICAVDPLAADAAAQLTYWVRERGMQGLRLTTHSEGVRLDDPRSFQLWEQASMLGIPVCVLTTPEHLDAVLTVASRFPSTAIALDHAGGIRGADSEPDTYALLSLAHLPNLYLKVTTENLAPLAALGTGGLDPWRRIVTAFGAQRLMWGSNYPVSQEGTYADMVDLGRKALPFLAEGERRWYLGETALRLWPELAERTSK
jgi:L-fuconolactonase